MRLPTMTTRRWMAVTVASAIALWLSVTAYHVETDRDGEWIYHLWERFDSIDPGSVYNSQHRAPFWTRYWRKLIGRPWPGNYACDPGGECESRWGRLAVTITAPSAEMTGEVEPKNGRFPADRHESIAISSYYNKYILQHWKEDEEGYWENNY
jgi:hypothetical protein